jgi:hypothetical protein
MQCSLFDNTSFGHWLDVAILLLHYYQSSMSRVFFNLIFLSFKFYLIFYQYLNVKLHADDSSDESNVTDTHRSFVIYFNIISQLLTTFTIVLFAFYGYSVSVKLKIYSCGFLAFLMLLVSSCIVGQNVDHWQFKIFALNMIIVGFLSGIFHTILFELSPDCLFKVCILFK